MVTAALENGPNEVISGFAIFCGPNFFHFPQSNSTAIYTAIHSNSTAIHTAIQQRSTQRFNSDPHSDPHSNPQPLNSDPHSDPKGCTQQSTVWL